MIKFNQSEWQLIEDRLNVPECVIECLEEDGHTPEAVNEAIQNIRRQLGYDPTDQLQAVVIQDCCEGSTLFVNDPGDLIAFGDMKPWQWAQMCKARRSLTLKTGFDIPTA